MTTPTLATPTCAQCRAEIPPGEEFLVKGVTDTLTTLCRKDYRRWAQAVAAREMNGNQTTTEEASCP